MWVLFGLFFLISMTLISIYMFAFSLFTPAIIANYTRKNTFGSLFDCRRFFKIIKYQFSTYLVVWLLGVVVYILASTAASIVGSFLFWVPFLGGILSLAGWPAQTYETRQWQTPPSTPIQRRTNPP